MSKLMHQPGRQLHHNWNYIGTDECNYICEPEGEALLAEFGRFAEKPIMCALIIFCTGNRRSFLKWGSTNVYIEDADGSPVYDFTTFDKILTQYWVPAVSLSELGFMPFHLADTSCYADSRLDEGALVCTGGQAGHALQGL